MRVRIWPSTCVGLSECFGPTRGWLRVIRIVQVVVRGARIYSIIDWKSVNIVLGWSRQPTRDPRPNYDLDMSRLRGDWIKSRGETWLSSEANSTSSCTTGFEDLSRSLEGAFVL